MLHCCMNKGSPPRAKSVTLRAHNTRPDPWCRLLPRPQPFPTKVSSTPSPGPPHVCLSSAAFGPALIALRTNQRPLSLPSSSASPLPPRACRHDDDACCLCSGPRGRPGCRLAGHGRQVLQRGACGGRAGGRRFGGALLSPPLRAVPTRPRILGVRDCCHDTRRAARAAVAARPPAHQGGNHTFSGTCGGPQPPPLAPGEHTRPRWPRHLIRCLFWRPCPSRTALAILGRMPARIGGGVAGWIVGTSTCGTAPRHTRGCRSQPPSAQGAAQC